MIMLKFKRLIVHQLVLVAMSIAYLSLALISNKVGLFYLLIALAFININIYLPIKWSRLSILIIGLLIFALSAYVSTTIFRLDNKLEIVSYMFSRIAAISLCSYLFIAALDFEELIIYLMQKKVLPVILAYAMLGAVNSITNIRTEFNKIKQVTFMRYYSYSSLIKVCYPLLVTTVRHALQLGITLEGRGLNSKKTFLYQASIWRRRDTLIILINLIGLIISYSLGRGIIH